MPAPLNSGAANTGTVQAPTSVTPTMGGAATAGNLLVLAANSDGTIATPSTWTLAVSAVDSQALYIFYKIAAGGETSLALTVGAPAAAALLEYGQNTATPLDRTASATRSASSAATQATGTTAATQQADELIVCAVGPHNWTTAPASPTWSGSVTQRLLSSSNPTFQGTRAGIIVGDKDVTATGTQTSTATWTNATTDAGGAVATFRLAAAVAFQARPPLSINQAVSRSYYW